MQKQPLLRFKELLAEAERLGIYPHNAFALATAGTDRQPSVRMLLLKEVDDRGLVFYTNLASRKARELTANPRASACFWWEPLKRQVRFEGRVELVSEQQADEYFASRPRGSQLGAWASRQSSAIRSREELLAEFASVEAKYKDAAVPRPAHWSGYRLVPERIEFWKEAPNRLHQRKLYTRDGEGWKLTLLAP
jgi:pyridoxamine 5'-phosphate oxidase